MSGLTAKDLHVGQKVKVVDVNGSRLGQPDHGWDGVITKVGRVKVTITYGGKSDMFRIQRQVVDDRSGHRSFRTLKQHEEYQRRDRVREVLHIHGLRIDFGSAVGLEKLERIVQILEEK